MDQDKKAQYYRIFQGDYHQLGKIKSELESRNRNRKSSEEKIILIWLFNIIITFQALHLIPIVIFLSSSMLGTHQAM